MLFRDAKGLVISSNRSELSDLSFLFANRGEPIYLDEGHITEHGNAIVARAIAKAILTDVEKPPLKKHSSGHFRGAVTDNLSGR